MNNKKQSVPRNNRIYIDKSWHPLYKELTESEGTEQVFDSMRNIFMFATFIGYQDGNKIPLTNKVDIFTWDILSGNESNVPLLRALALTETEDIEVLTDQGKILDIAEQYANAGIIEIKKKIGDIQENRIMHLISLLAPRLPNELISNLLDE